METPCLLNHRQSDRSITRLSGPITGGPRYIRWERNVGCTIETDEQTYKLLQSRQVIEPNIDELKERARQLRDAGNQLIEPASFAPRSDWSQHEFYRFWEGIIAGRAKAVRFLAGWESSVGCTYEYLCAVRGGKDTLSENAEPLGTSAALILIDTAVEEMSGISKKLDLHRARLLSMKEAIAFAHQERVVVR